MLVRRPLRDQYATWGVEELLQSYPGLAIRPHAADGLLVAGEFFFFARRRRVEITDSYSIEIVVPDGFPQLLPQVKEVGGRIPADFHHYPDGTLCLGSPIRLYLLIGRYANLSDFARRCLLPYLFGYSYREKYGRLPFGELEHGHAGIMSDLRNLLAVDDDVQVLRLLDLAGTPRMKANRQRCPCDSGQRVGRCHHMLLNELRGRLSGAACRQLHHLLYENEFRTKREFLAQPWRPLGRSQRMSQRVRTGGPPSVTS